MNAGEAWSWAHKECRSHMPDNLSAEAVQHIIAWAAGNADSQGVTPVTLQEDIRKQCGLPRKATANVLRRLRQSGWLQDEQRVHGVGISYRLTLTSWAANHLTAKLDSEGTTNDTQHHAA